MNSVLRLQIMAIAMTSGRVAEVKHRIDEAPNSVEGRLRILELVKGIRQVFAAARRSSDNGP